MTYRERCEARRLRTMRPATREALAGARAGVATACRAARTCVQPRDLSSRRLVADRDERCRQVAVGRVLLGGAARCGAGPDVDAETCAHRWDTFELPNRDLVYHCRRCPALVRATPYGGEMVLLGNAAGLRAVRAALDRAGVPAIRRGIGPFGMVGGW